MRVEIDKSVVEDTTHGCNILQFGKMFKTEKPSCYDDQRVEFFFIYCCPYGYNYFIGSGYSQREAINNMKDTGLNSYKTDVLVKFLNNLSILTKEVKR